MLELIYTSVPKGLLPGSRGFATVAMTTGMPPQIVQACEALSSYTQVFGLESEHYSNNPVAYSYLRIRLGPHVLYALSRTSAAAADYSGRNNKLSHHMVLDPASGDTLQDAGPATLIEALKFREQWTGDPDYLSPRMPPSLPNPPRTPPNFHAKHWHAAGLPTALAARLAGAWMTNPSRPTFLVFKPEGVTNSRILGLIGDAIRLLPPELRWGVTFNTYLSTDPLGGDCLCRGVLAGSPAFALAQRLSDTLVVDVETGRFTGGEYATATSKELEPAADGLELPPWTDPTKRPKEISQEQLQNGPTGTLERVPLRIQTRPTSEKTIEPALKPTETAATTTPNNRLLFVGIAAATVLFISVVTFLWMNQSKDKKEAVLGQADARNPITAEGTTQTVDTTHTPTNHTQPLPPKPANANQPTLSAPTNTEGSITAQKLPNHSDTKATTTPQPTNPPIAQSLIVANKTVASQLTTEPKPFFLCNEETLSVSTNDVHVVTTEGTTYQPILKPPSPVSGLKEWQLKRTSNDSEALAMFTLGNPPSWRPQETLYFETPKDRQIVLVANNSFKAAGKAEISNRQVVVTITCNKPLSDLVNWILLTATNRMIESRVEGITCELTPEKSSEPWILKGVMPEKQIDLQAKKIKEELEKWRQLNTKLKPPRKDTPVDDIIKTMKTFCELIRANTNCSGTLTQIDLPKVDQEIKSYNREKEKASKPGADKAKKLEINEFKMAQDHLSEAYNGDIGVMMFNESVAWIKVLEIDVPPATPVSPQKPAILHPKGTIEFKTNGKTILTATIDKFS